MMIRLESHVGERYIDTSEGEGDKRLDSFVDTLEKGQSFLVLGVLSTCEAF